MSVEPGPHTLDDLRPILGPTGDATLKRVTPSFYDELGSEFGSFERHTLIQRSESDAPWGMWEMHPKGDEFVYLLSGATDFLLKRPGQPVERLRIDRPGDYLLVPRGVWHTAEPQGRCALLFVTPGEGTRNEPEPPE